MTKGKFVYKDKNSMKKMHEFYDRVLDSLKVEYSESYFDTSFGRTHSLIVGDLTKPRICTIHGGNGITPLNIKLFLPLLDKYSIIAPDVVGMPGKSDPYRNISSKKDEYGQWIAEVLDHYNEEKMSFVVSSYSSAMFLSFAKSFPQRVDKAVLLVPSGIDHGPVMPMIRRMVIPFIKYYISPDEKILGNVLEYMGGKDDEVWKEFFDLMMSAYKMELRPPKEYKKEELKDLNAPLFIIASKNDIFFPADKVFKRAKEIFNSKITTQYIESKHLPTKEVMADVCKMIISMFQEDVWKCSPKHSKHEELIPDL